MLISARSLIFICDYLNYVICNWLFLNRYISETIAYNKNLQITFLFNFSKTCLAIVFWIVNFGTSFYLTLYLKRRFLLILLQKLDCRYCVCIYDGDMVYFRTAQNQDSVDTANWWRLSALTEKIAIPSHRQQKTDQRSVIINRKNCFAKIASFLN